VVTDTELTGKRREILDFIADQLRDRGYPPSVREIGEAVGLTSSSTVHTHLTTLQKQGYLRRDPTKPRAIEVRYDAMSGAAIDRRPTRHVPVPMSWPRSEWRSCSPFPPTSPATASCSC
jgi:repressor LexA